MMDLFLQTHIFWLHKTLTDGLEWWWIIVMFLSCLDSHFDGTYSLQRSIAEQVMQCYISPNREETISSTSCMCWGWVHSMHWPSVTSVFTYLCFSRRIYIGCLSTGWANPASALSDINLFACVYRDHSLCYKFRDVAVHIIKDASQKWEWNSAYFSLKRQASLSTSFTGEICLTWWMCWESQINDLSSLRQWSVTAVNAKHERVSVWEHMHTG